jgi:ABC-type glycerol-3-phosphate transport system permease component
MDELSETSLSLPKARSSSSEVVSKLNNRRVNQFIRQTIVFILLILVLIIFLLPFLWMFFGSVRPDRDIFSNLAPFTWRTIFPTEWTLENIRAVLETGFSRHLINSFIVAGITVPLALLFDSMAAYAFAWLRVPLKNLLFGLLLVIMIIPEQSTIIPLYLTVTSINLQDTFAALIIPFIARPFGIFTLRQFMLDMPKELADSAMVDGASPFDIYWHIMLPNLKPALVTVGLVDFMWAWNQFFWPLIAIQTPEKQVAQVAVASFMDPEVTKWAQLFAASTLASLPVILLFLLLQRQYIRGIARTGIKG